MLKVFFGAHAALATTEQWIQDYEREQNAVRSRYRAIRTMVGDDLADRPEVPFWLLSLRRGELLTDARLRWCREARATLRALVAGQEDS
jgi:hypothetical protein